MVISPVATNPAGRRQAVWDLGREVREAFWKDTPGKDTRQRD